MQQANFKLAQRTTFRRILVIVDANRNPIDLTGCTFEGQARTVLQFTKNVQQDVKPIIFTLTPILPLRLGQVELKITPEATATIQNGEFQFDVIMKKDEDTFQVIEGTLSLSARVTRPQSGEPYDS